MSERIRAFDWGNSPLGHPENWSSTQRFELALQGSFVTLAYQDRELRYTWIYNRALRLSIPEAIGKTDVELFPAEDAAVLVEIKRAVMQSGERRRQTVSLTTQGTQRYLDLLVEPNLGPDGSIDGVRLNNAAKYTDSGGRIELSARVAMNRVSMTVKDNGIGIPPQSLDRIFDMFAQIDSQSPRTEGGLGIGLSLVKGLVELHGGTTEVASAGAGQGSEFTVNLPLPAVDMDATQAAATDAMPHDAAGRRVLIADDNRDAADSLAMLLEIDGHEVRVAHGGHAALALAQAFRPEVALLDIGMPELSGYEVAKALRKEPWGKAMQLIALTGWGQESDRRHSKAAGFDWHLTKPIDMDTLCTVLKDR